MKQPSLNELFEQLEAELIKKTKEKPIIRNSEPLREGSWTQKIVSQVRISDLAKEFGVDCCPNHKNPYPIIFDDTRGWFICVKAKYEPSSCDFKGNIVEFVKRCG